MTIHYPDATPDEVCVGFALVKAWDNALLLNCNRCGLDLGVWTDKAGVVLPENVTMLARHLFTAHFVNHLSSAASGKHD